MFFQRPHVSLVSSTTNREAEAVDCAEGGIILYFDGWVAFVQSKLNDEVFMRLPPRLGERSGTDVHLRTSL